MDNDENRRAIEYCYRTRKTLINPIINWSDADVWDYIKKENIEVNPLYHCGFWRVGCIGCPMAGKHRIEEFERYPKFKDAYLRAFDKALKTRKEKGMPAKDKWSDAEALFKWWMEDDTDPDQITLEEYFDELGIRKDVGFV